MPRKNKDLAKEYNKRYTIEHKNEINTRRRKNDKLNTKGTTAAEQRWKDSHKDEIREYQRKWRKANNNPEYNRKQWLLRTYGISVSEYDEILTSQGGVCAICGAGKAGKSLPVDHKHVPDYGVMLPEERRKYVRGILCSDCNKALGLVKDNITILENMIRYLMDYE